MLHATGLPSLTLVEVDVRRNEADIGGGIWTNAGAVQHIQGGVYEDNVAGLGGAVAINGDAHIEGAAFCGNTASVQGGAIWWTEFDANSLVGTDLLFAENVAEDTFVAVDAQAFTWGPVRRWGRTGAEKRMVAVVAQILVIVSGLWLLAVGVLMLVWPEVARRGLASMASTPAIHFGEHALRFLAGLAFVGAAELSKAPWVFQVFGGFLAVSSVIIVLAPRRWHVRYAEFWAEKLQPWMFRVLSPVSFLGGGAVIWAASP